jgi:hypothetical protein
MTGHVLKQALTSRTRRANLSGQQVLQVGRTGNACKLTWRRRTLARPFPTMMQKLSLIFKLRSKKLPLFRDQRIQIKVAERPLPKATKQVGLDTPWGVIGPGSSCCPPENVFFRNPSLALHILLLAALQPCSLAAFQPCSLAALQLAACSGQPCSLTTWSLARCHNDSKLTRAEKSTTHANVGLRLPSLQVCSNLAARQPPAWFSGIGRRPSNQNISAASKLKRPATGGNALDKFLQLKPHENRSGPLAPDGMRQQPAHSGRSCRSHLALLPPNSLMSKNECASEPSGSTKAANFLAVMYGWKRGHPF